MPASRPSIRPGRIVFAWISDRNGHPKLRPAVIVNEEDPTVDPLILMSITTTFTEPPPDFCIPLAWHPKGHPVTRLHKRSAAVTNWLSTATAADIIGFGGDVPPKTMRLIRNKLNEL